MHLTDRKVPLLIPDLPLAQKCFIYEHDHLHTCSRTHHIELNGISIGGIRNGRNQLTDQYGCRPWRRLYRGLDYSSRGNLGLTVDAGNESKVVWIGWVVGTYSSRTATLRFKFSSKNFAGLKKSTMYRMTVHRRMSVRLMDWSWRYELKVSHTRTKRRQYLIAVGTEDAYLLTEVDTIHTVRGSVVEIWNVY